MSTVPPEVAGLEMAMQIIEQDGRPGPGGINITNGVPSEIYIQIGRGNYFADEYTLASDVAKTVREDIITQISRRIQELISTS